ncbi:MAG: S8 family serine peptidase, partial [Gammaproteobacteria bacterium]|nr:S8 family serine peptidase [Gammaproteobacteria bacterium]
MLVIGALSAQIVTAPGFAQASTAALDAGVSIQRHSKGIRAVLVDQPGDYYLRPDGSRINLRRKQGVFALEVDELDGHQIEQSLKNRFGNQVERINAKHLGNRLVFHMRPTAAKSKNESRNLKRDDRRLLKSDAETTLKSMLPVAARASQVFANARGEGDLVLLPRITLKLHAGVSPTKLDVIARRYGLALDRKLKVPGQVYSLKLRDSRLNATAQFALVRALAANQAVKWAEPQFVAKPFKTQFVPNDQFLSQQWHLRDRGFRGSRCDTDCDATDAWDLGNANGIGAVSGDGTVIAIIDDGVQLDHPDLQSNIWINAAEQNGTPNVDDDMNGYVDDINGWDFVVDSSANPNLQNSAFAGGGTCSIGVDSSAGPDNDPSPQATTNCFTINGDAVEQDNHGTAVAGLAAAVGGNNIGVAGTAYRASILPIRAISDFDTANGASFCVNIAEAMAYAGRYADVINNSWGMNDACLALEDVISEVVTGLLLDAGDNNISKRPNLGSPVLFASGNSASGWVRISVPVGVGEKAYEWRFLRSAFPDDFDVSAEDNSAWLDEIRFPGGQAEGFEDTLGAFQSGIALNNRCDAECTSFINPARSTWAIETDPERVFLGSQSAVIDTTASDCGNSFLSVLRDD